MYFSRSFIASALLGLGAATTHAGEGMGMAMTASESLAAAPTPGAAPGGMVNMHVVQVGGSNGSLAFYPENIQAQPGDLVQFQFNAKNHSVVQSTFDQPCVPIQNIMPNKTDAFFSGFMPTNASIASTSNKLTYTIRVMDTKPVWFYCSQAKHCQSGMVGAINAAATGNRTMEAFKVLAASAPENLTPGQATGSGSGSGSGSTPGAAPSGGSGTGSEATASGGASATGTAGANPAQQTANLAPGLMRQSVLGLGLGGLAAFIVL